MDKDTLHIVCSEAYWMWRIQIAVLQSANVTLLMSIKLATSLATRQRIPASLILLAKGQGEDAYIRWDRLLDAIRFLRSVQKSTEKMACFWNQQLCGLNTPVKSLKMLAGYKLTNR